MNINKEFYFGGITKVAFKDGYGIFADCGGVIEFCGPVGGSCVTATIPQNADCRSGTLYWCQQNWDGAEYYGSVATAGTC